MPNLWRRQPRKTAARVSSAQYRLLLGVLAPLILILALLLLTQVALANRGSSSLATTVYGGIFTNTTWYAAQSPYIVTGTVIVFPAYTLTVEPGVEVRFAAGMNLTMRGALVAIGTASNPITFTADTTPTQGAWSGIAIANSQGGRAALSFAKVMGAQTALSVECCYSGGPVNIADSDFITNTIALGGYSGWASQCVRCRFENNLYALNTADKLIFDSIFRNNTYGLYSTERVSVYNSTFTGNQTAIHGGRGEIKYSTIISNVTGIQQIFEGFTVSYNTIAGNSVGVMRSEYGGTLAPVQYNAIYSNTTYNMQNTGAADKDATYNWWGTTNTSAIDAGIYDAMDDLSLGLIHYQPILLPPTVQLSAATYSVTETAGAAIITTTLSSPWFTTVTVGINTSDGSASSQTDYVPVSRTLAIAPGTTSVTTTVPITDDIIYAGNVTATLTLSNPVGAALGAPSTAVLTIVEEDLPPTVQFSAPAYTVLSSAGTAPITVTLSAVSGVTATVNYTTSGGTAIAGVDYVAAGGTLTFSPGITTVAIGLGVIDHATPQFDKTLIVSLQSPVSSTLGAPVTATVTIGDDDLLHIYLPLILR